jgi:hypothetical protein
VRGERGVALVVAVVVLTVIGALVAAAFFAGLQEQRMGEQTRLLQRAMGAAEAGSGELMRQWPLTASSLAVYPGDSLSLPAAPTPGGTGTFAAAIYRMGHDLYLLEVEGRDHAGVARVRLGLLVRADALCDTSVVEGLEMSQSKCHIGNAFEELPGRITLRSRAWFQLFEGT